MRSLHWVITFLLVIILVHFTSAQNAVLTYDYESAASDVYVMAKFTSPGFDYLQTDVSVRNVFSVASLGPITPGFVSCHTSTPNLESPGSRVDLYRDYATNGIMPITIEFNREGRAGFGIHSCVFSFRPMFISKELTANDIIFTSLLPSLQFKHGDTTGRQVSVQFTHTDNPDYDQKAVISPSIKYGSSQFIILGEDDYQYDMIIPLTILNIRKGNSLIINHPFEFDQFDVKCYDLDDDGNEIVSNRFKYEKVSYVSSGNAYIPQPGPSTFLSIELISRKDSHNSPTASDQMKCHITLAPTGPTKNPSPGQHNLEFMLAKTGYSRSTHILPPLDPTLTTSMIVPKEFLGESLFPSSIIAQSLGTTLVGATTFKPFYISRLSTCKMNVPDAVQDEDCLMTPPNRIIIKGSYLKLGKGSDSKPYFDLDFDTMKVESLCTNDDSGCNFLPELCPGFTFRLFGENKNTVRFTSSGMEYIQDLSCKIDVKLNISKIVETPPETATDPPTYNFAPKIKTPGIDDIPLPYVMTYHPAIEVRSKNIDTFQSPIRGNQLEFILRPAIVNRKIYPIAPGTVSIVTGFTLHSPDDVQVRFRRASNVPVEVSSSGTHSFVQLTPEGPDLYYPSLLLQLTHVILSPTNLFDEERSLLAFEYPYTSGPTFHATSIEVNITGFYPQENFKEKTQTDEVIRRFIAISHSFTSIRTFTHYLVGLIDDPQIHIGLYNSLEDIISDYNLDIDEITDDPWEDHASAQQDRCVENDTTSNGECVASPFKSHAQSNPSLRNNNHNVLANGVVGKVHYMMVKFSNLYPYRYDQFLFENLRSLKFIPSLFQRCLLVRSVLDDDGKHTQHVIDKDTALGSVTLDGPRGIFVFTGAASNVEGQSFTPPTLTVNTTDESYTMCITPFLPGTEVLRFGDKDALEDIPNVYFTSVHSQDQDIGGAVPLEGSMKYFIKDDITIDGSRTPSYSLHVVSSNPQHKDNILQSDSISIVELRLYNVLLSRNNFIDKVTITYQPTDGSEATEESKTIGLDVLTDEEQNLAKKYLTAHCPNGTVTTTGNSQRLEVEIQFYDLVSATDDFPVYCQFPVATLSSGVHSMDIIVRHGSTPISVKEGYSIPQIQDTYDFDIEVRPTEDDLLQFEVGVQEGVIYRFLNAIPYHHVSNECRQMQDVQYDPKGDILADVYSAPTLSFFLIDGKRSGKCAFIIDPTVNSQSYQAYWEAAGFIFRTPYSVVDVNDKNTGEIDLYISHASQQQLPYIRDPRIGTQFTTGSSIVLNIFRHNFYPSQMFIIPLPPGTLIDPLFTTYQLDLCDQYFAIETSYNHMNSTHTIYIKPSVNQQLTQVDEKSCNIPITFTEPTVGVDFPVYLTPNQRNNPRWSEAQRKAANIGTIQRYTLQLPTISSIYKLETQFTTQHVPTALLPYTAELQFTYTSLLYDVRSNVLQVDISSLKIDERIPFSCAVYGYDSIGQETSKRIVSHRYTRAGGYLLTLALPPVKANEPSVIKCKTSLLFYGFRMLAAPILTEFPTGIKTVASVDNPNFPLLEFDTYSIAEKEKIFQPGLSTVIKEILCMDLIFLYDDFLNENQSNIIRQIIYSIVSLRDQKITYDSIIFLSQSRAPTSQPDKHLLVRIGFDGINVNNTRLEVKFAGIDFIRYLSNDFSLLSYSIVDKQPGDVRFGRTKFHSLACTRGRCGVTCGVPCFTNLCTSYDLECAFNQVCFEKSCRDVNDRYNYLPTPFKIPVRLIINSSSMVFLSMMVFVFVAVMAILPLM